MQFTIDTPSELERKLTVEVPSSDVQEKVDKKVSELARKVKLPGFRPGKVPHKVVFQRYGKEVIQEVKEACIQESLAEIVEKESLRLAGSPIIDTVAGELGQPFVYTASLEILPEIEIKELEGVQFEREKVEVTDEDVERALYKLRRKHAVWDSQERPSKMGDKLRIDTEAWLEGEKFPPGCVEGLAVEIGAKQMIPGFEEGLIGSEVGQVVELNLVFPERYHNESAAGKAVRFKILVKDVAEPELPELDDIFAITCFDEEDVATLREKVRDGMHKDLENRVKERVKERLFELLVDRYPMKLPKIMLEQEMKFLRNRVPKGTVRSEEKIRKAAEKRIITTLLIAAYVEKYEIKFEEHEKLDQLAREIAGAYKDEERFLNSLYRDKRSINMLKEKLIEEKLVERILETFEVKDKIMTYDEFYDV